MPVSAKFKPIGLSPRKRRRRGRPTKAQASLKAQRNSQATRDRLVRQAPDSPAFEGMSLAETSAFITSKLDAFIASYPWWYGCLPYDKARKPMTDAQRQALEKARQRKADIQREVARPYAPETPYATRPSKTEGSLCPLPLEA